MKRKHYSITKTFSYLDNVFFVIIYGLFFEARGTVELANGMGEIEKLVNFLFVNSQENDILKNGIWFLFIEKANHLKLCKTIYLTLSGSHAFNALCF